MKIIQVQNYDLETCFGKKIHLNDIYDALYKHISLLQYVPMEKFMSLFVYKHMYRGKKFNFHQ